VPEDRHAVVSLIKRFYEQAKDDELVWTKSNVLQLVKYVKLDDIYKMRACYFASKTDPQVLCLLEDEVSASTPAKNLEAEDDDVSVAAPDSAGKMKKQQKIDCFVSTFPHRLLKAYRDNRNSKVAQNKLFHHLTNKAAQAEYNHKKHVAPSAALDIEMSEQQTTFLNPRFYDVLSGSIMYDCKGKGAMQLLAK